MRNMPPLAPGCSTCCDTCNPTSPPTRRAHSSPLSPPASLPIRLLLTQQPPLDHPPPHLSAELERLEGRLAVLENVVAAGKKNVSGAGGPNSRDKGAQCDDLGFGDGGGGGRGGGGGSKGGGGKKKGKGGAGEDEASGKQAKTNFGSLAGLGIDDSDDDDGTDALAGLSEVDRLLRKRGSKRQRESRMITNLKQGKVMPSWMVHKATGTLMQARIDYEKEMADRGEDAEGEDAEEQEFGEFCEDRFVELYGLQKVAKENLRDMVKGLRKASEKHVRLKMFRVSTMLVPGDEEDGSGVPEGANHFYRLALRQLVQVRSEDYFALPYRARPYPCTP